MRLSAGRVSRSRSVYEGESAGAHEAWPAAREGVEISGQKVGLRDHTLFSRETPIFRRISPLNLTPFQHAFSAALALEARV
jgi:hypothetical protein